MANGMSAVSGTHEHHHHHHHMAPAAGGNQPAAPPSSSTPSASGGGSAPQGTNNADGFTPSEESADSGNNSQSEMEQEMQTLLQEIQQLTQQVQQDIASGQDPTSDEDQLNSDTEQLAQLMSQMGGGGTSGGGGNAEAVPAAGGIPSGGSGGGAPSGSGGGAPSGGGSSALPSSGGASAPTSGGSTYDGGSGNASPQSVKQNAQIVAQVAQSKGVDPVTAVATMLVESGGNNQSVGDGGTSFGLFQLHQGGELPSGWSQQQAFDPKANAEVALSQFASLNGKYSDPGQLAAAAQRPADPAGYARAVDGKLAEARQLLGMG